MHSQMPPADPPEDVFARLKAGLDVRAGGAVVSGGAPLRPVGLPPLDEALHGGLVSGAIASFEGVGSCGRTAILAHLLARTSHRALVAIVDDGSLYPPDLERAGARLDRVAIVPAVAPAAVARAADILLRSRAFSIVVMPGVSLKATVWSRLSALAHKADTLLVTLSGAASNELAYFASTRLRCALERVVWSNQSGIFCELAGYDVSAQVLKHRRGAPGGVARLRVVAAREGEALRERALGERPRALRAVV